MHLTRSFLLLLIISGVADGGYIEQDKSVLMPLALGNYWTMNFRAPNVSGEMDRGELTIRVITDSLITGDQWFYIVGGLLDDMWWANQSNGLNVRGDKYSGLLFKYPAEKWDIYPAIANSKVLVVETNRQIRVPAGTFSCYEYLHYDAGGNIRFFLAPDIGIVKVLFYGGEESAVGEVELIEYSTKYQ